jgi:hypothetical protein
MTFKGAELNYPVHEKEMLAIICAPNKWCSNLINVPILIYTNHKTLENFDSQKYLSCHQARWMKFMSQYNCKIIYVKGRQNIVANALSQTSFEMETSMSVPYPPETEESRVLLEHVCAHIRKTIGK